MNIVQKRLSELHKVERNVRKHSPEQIAEYTRSVIMFGQLKPIIIDEQGMILAGNGLYDALIGAGKETAACLVKSGLSDKQKKKLMVADNRLYELGSNDMDTLNEILREIDDTDIPGWDEDFLQQFLDSTDTEEMLEECEAEWAHENGRPAAHAPSSESPRPSMVYPPVTDNPPADPPVQPKAKRGEIYRLGRHRLMCGDSTCIPDVNRLMDNRMADLLLTDPPYNVDYTGATKDALKIMNDNMDDSSFRRFLTDAFTAANAVMNPGAAFYIWHADSHGFDVRGACQNCGWIVRQCLIWNKNSLVLGRQDYQWKHEPCLYGWKEGAPHLWMSDRKQTTVMDFDKPQRSDIHPTMKPVALFDYLIQNSTEKGGSILDLFGGSGTTIIACEQNGRNAFVMELDPRYVDVIIARWEELTGEKAELIESE